MKMLLSAAALAGIWIAVAASTLSTVAQAPAALEQRAPFVLTETIVVVAPAGEIADAGGTRAAEVEPSM